MSDLDKLRKQIDNLDEQLLKTVAQRMEVVELIGRYKKEKGLELRDDTRFQALLDGQIKRAKELDLPPELVTELSELIHKFSLERQEKV